MLTDKVVAEFGTNAKMNPPPRSGQHRDAICEVLGDGDINAIFAD